MPDGVDPPAAVDNNERRNLVPVVCGYADPAVMPDGDMDDLTGAVGQGVQLGRGVMAERGSGPGAQYRGP
jgi:hypothetical protein